MVLDYLACEKAWGRFWPNLTLTWLQHPMKWQECNDLENIQLKKGFVTLFNHSESSNKWNQNHTIYSANIHSAITNLQHSIDSYWWESHKIRLGESVDLLFRSGFLVRTVTERCNKPSDIQYVDRVQYFFYQQINNIINFTLALKHYQ